MKGAFRTLLVVTVFACAVHPGCAQCRYTIAEGEITITGYSGPGEDEMIPSMIDELPVTAIEQQAFYSITSLTSITIPDSITSIGDSAFIGCTNLTMGSWQPLGTEPASGEGASQTDNAAGGDQRYCRVFYRP